MQAALSSGSEAHGRWPGSQVSGRKCVQLHALYPGTRQSPESAGSHEPFIRQPGRHVMNLRKTGDYIQFN
ncbi:MAG: hypothetical protein GX425_10080 [Peptococcaceae bacterium]|nr:hypothetical protein [Peptococcaceae bacterium]